MRIYVVTQEFKHGWDGLTTKTIEGAYSSEDGARRAMDRLSAADTYSRSDWDYVEVELDEESP